MSLPRSVTFTAQRSFRCFWTGCHGFGAVRWGISVTEINGEPSPDAGLNFFEGQCCHLAVMVSNQHGRDSNWNRMPKLDQLRHSHLPPTGTAKQQQTIQKQRFSKIVDCPNFCPTFVKNCLKFLKDPINLDFLARLAQKWISVTIFKPLIPKL